MANEKKKQTSTSKNKTTKAKEKQTKLKNEKKETLKVESKKETNTPKEKKKATNQTTSNKKNDKVKVENEHNNKVQIDKGKESKEKIKKEKENHKVKNEKVASSIVASSDEMGKLIKIILVLIVIVIAFYGLTILITKFQKNTIPDRNQNDTPAVIQYDEILIGTMLKQAREEYYVLIQKDDDQYRTLTSYYLQRYSSNSKALKVYMSNMNSVYNQFYISGNSNIKPNSINEFRVSKITLVKVKNHEIVEAYEGIEEIEKAFKELLSEK